MYPFVFESVSLSEVERDGKLGGESHRNPKIKLLNDIRSIFQSGQTRTLFLDAAQYDFKSQVFAD